MICYEGVDPTISINVRLKHLEHVLGLDTEKGSPGGRKGPGGRSPGREKGHAAALGLDTEKGDKREQ